MANHVSLLFVSFLCLFKPILTYILQVVDPLGEAEVPFDAIASIQNFLALAPELAIALSGFEREKDEKR